MRTGVSVGVRARLATTCAVLLATSAVAIFAAPGVSLPTEWSSRDIGVVGTPGSAFGTENVFVVTGAGTDIGGEADSFHFVYRRLDGDGEIVAQVSTLQYLHEWTRAGVMIRESLAPTARQAAMLVSAGRGVSFASRTSMLASASQAAAGAPQAGAAGEQEASRTTTAPRRTPAAQGGTPLRGSARAAVRRDAPGSSAAGAAHATAAPEGAPYFVRLVRTGDIFHGYKSFDGTTWVHVGSDTIRMGATVFVGLAITGHAGRVLTTATFQHVRVVERGTTQRSTATPAAPSAMAGGRLAPAAEAAAPTLRPAPQPAPQPASQPAPQPAPQQPAPVAPPAAEPPPAPPAPAPAFTPEPEPEPAPPPAPAPAPPAPAPSPPPAVVQPAPQPEPEPAPAPAPPPVTSPSSSQRTFRLLHWNIRHGGIGTDGRLDPDRVAAWVARMNPDVISFNEVDDAAQAAMLHEKVTAHTGATWTSTYSGWGNQILSRLPVRDSSVCHFNPSAGRRAAHASLSINGRVVNLWSAHLDVDSSSTRLSEVYALQACTRDWSEARIMAGDYNMQQSSSEYAAAVTGHADAWATARSMGSTYNYGGNCDGCTRNSRIDYVFSSTGAWFLRIQSAQIYDTRDGNGYMPSDHKPLVVTYAVD